MKTLDYPDELVIARLWVRQRLPYLTHAIMALRPVCRPGLGTCCTDKWMRLYFDPAVVKKWNRDELGFVIAHEALHNELRHHARLVGCPQKLRNWACDLAINSLLVRAGLTPPADVLLPDKFGFKHGLSAEEYAGLLVQHEQDQQKQEQAQQAAQEDQDDGEEEGEEEGEGGESQTEGGEGDDEGEDAGEGDGVGASDEPGGSGDSEGDDEGNGPGDGEKQARPADADSQGAPGEPAPSGEGQPELKPGDPFTGRQPDRSQGEGGSSCDGQQKPWECPPPDASADPSDNPPGLDDWNQEWIRRKDAEALENHPEWGNVPGMLRREAQRLLRPKTDPVALLRAAVKFAITQTAGYGTFTYRRPSRKQMPGGAILPAHRTCVPKVVVIADTSGSMGSTDLALALGIVQSVIQGLPDPQGVQVIAGDTAARTCERVFRPEQVTLAGGGGTDMGRLILEACEKRPCPDVILLVTDGWTPYPPHPVRPKVVVALTRRGARQYVPSWMECVEINPEE